MDSLWEGLDWQTCKVQFSGELWINCRDFHFHKCLQNQPAINIFRRDNSTPVHSLSILKTFLISKKCLCGEGEFREVAKQWQSAGMNKRNIWPLQFSVLLTVFQRQTVSKSLIVNILCSLFKKQTIIAACLPRNLDVKIYKLIWFFI